MGRARAAAVSFWHKAYEDNLTGLASMVAYNLLLSIFPIALVALFVAGRVLRSEDLQDSVLLDLKQVFPTAAESTLSSAVRRLQSSSTSAGIAALAAAVWFASSFWGALDTAFCRIYHRPCRSWVRQKLFALGMFVVVLLFIVATVAVPALQSLLITGADDLPFGLSEVEGLIYGVTLAAGVDASCSSRCAPRTCSCRAVAACRGGACGPARSARRSRSASSTTGSRCTWRTSRRCAPAPRSCSC